MTSASRASYSPESRVRTSSTSTALWIRASSRSASASASASPSSWPSSTMHLEVVEAALEVREAVEVALEQRRAARSPGCALAWSSHRSGAATCSPRSAISARIASRSSTCSMVCIVAWSCLISGRSLVLPHVAGYDTPRAPVAHRQPLHGERHLGYGSGFRTSPARREEHHEGCHLARQARRPRRGGPRPPHREAQRRDRPRHLERPVRLRPPPLRDARPVHGPGRRPRSRADGHRRGGRPRGRRPRRR